MLREVAVKPSNVMISFSHELVSNSIKVLLSRDASCISGSLYYPEYSKLYKTCSVDNQSINFLGALKVLFSHLHRHKLKGKSSVSFKVVLVSHA